MNQYISKKISALRFICIALVVLGHGSYVSGQSFINEYPIASFVQRLISGGLTQPSVRLLFLISGYLFFQNLTDKYVLKTKLKRRMKTLLIPYVLWNLVYVSYFIVMAVVPPVESMINNDMISQLHNANIPTLFYILFISPANGPLWFVRNLMIFSVIMAPLFFAVRNHTKIVWGGYLSYS